MTREVHEIPPAPRSVRWTGVIWRRWPLGVLGCVMAIYGGLWTLMLHYHWTGKPGDDDALDAAAIASEARILKVVPTHTQLRGQPAERVYYEFRPRPTDSLPTRGACFSVAGAHEVGTAAPVEYLAEEPHINRLVGSRLSLLANLVTPALAFVVFPGVLLVLLWVQGIIDLKVMLTRGDVARAEELTVRRVQRVVPVMLVVDYAFRDRRAALRVGRHWVRQRSRLGQRLEAAPSEVAVASDRARPARSWLVIADDFVPVASTELTETG